MSAFALVFQRDWGSHKRGDTLTDPAEVAAALAARAPVSRVAAASAAAPETPTVAEAIAEGVAAAEAALHAAS